MGKLFEVMATKRAEKLRNRLPFQRVPKEAHRQVDIIEVYRHKERIAKP